MAARGEQPLYVRRWQDLVEASRQRCARCDAVWLDRSERWRLVRVAAHPEDEHVLLCPDCRG
jgi:Zn-finger nucleic acid-binding protein